MNKENAIITIGNRSQTSPCCTINNTAFYCGSRCSDHNRSPFRLQPDRKLMDILLLVNSSLLCTFARCSVTFCWMSFSFFLEVGILCYQRCISETEKRKPNGFPLPAFHQYHIRLFVSNLLYFLTSLSLTRKFICSNIVFTELMIGLRKW